MEHNKLKRGQEIELSISNLAFGGQGIAKVGDLIFFVKDAIPNQRVLARISRIKKKYVEAYKVKTLKTSKDDIVNMPINKLIIVRVPIIIKRIPISLPNTLKSEVMIFPKVSKNDEIPLCALILYLL